MLNDGTKEYDQANDGEANALGACSVRFKVPLFVLVLKLIKLPWEQANYRRTNVATKLKVTYMKDELLQVSLSDFSDMLRGNDDAYSRSKFITKLVCCYNCHLF